MAQTHNELGKYLQRIGENLNFINNKLKKLEERMEKISEEIDDIKYSSDIDKGALTGLVNILTESLSEIPPIPEEKKSITEGAL